MTRNEVYDTMERGYSDGSPSPRHRESREHVHGPPTPSTPAETYYHKKHAPLTLESVGRAIAVRGMRAMRRGNLPFLIVFLTALFVFFGALAGIGYVDPDAQAAPESEFVMGQPVFDVAEGQRLREIAIQEQRALEAAWQKKARPNAGEWMNKQRNDGAVRAVEVQDTVIESPEEATEEPEHHNHEDH